MNIVEFMQSKAGRGARIAAGVILIIVGALVVQGWAGVLIAVVGLVPLAAGVFDFCLLGPLFGTDLRGHPRRA
jgi:uncharacterized oligopeptide transporter (OPT) family protein